jgi:hypothetical protein
VPEKDPRSRENMQLKRSNGKNHPRGYRLRRIGLGFCLLASLLVMMEGVVLEFVSPLLYGAQLLASWGGYIDLLIGIIMFIGSIVTANAGTRGAGAVAGATSIGFCAIASLVLFGGGFYFLGSILGLVGALLTSTGE